MTLTDCAARFALTEWNITVSKSTHTSIIRVFQVKKNVCKYLIFFLYILKKNMLNLNRASIVHKTYVGQHVLLKNNRHYRALLTGWLRSSADPCWRSCTRGSAWTPEDRTRSSNSLPEFLSAYTGCPGNTNVNSIREIRWTQLIIIDRHGSTRLGNTPLQKGSVYSIVFFLSPTRKIIDFFFGSIATILYLVLPTLSERDSQCLGVHKDKTIRSNFLLMVGYQWRNWVKN